MKKYSLCCFILISLTALLISCDDGKKGDPSTVIDSDNVTEELLDSTLQSLNNLIAADPNNYINYLERAKYFGANQMYQKAFDDLARAIEADSTKGEIYLYKGQLYWTKQQIKEAYEEYKICLHFDSVNTDCLLKKAGIDIALKNYDLATNHINAALMINEYLAEAYYLRGRLYKDKKDTTLAASSYATAVEVDPNYYDAYIELGLLYAAQKSDLAKEYYSSAIALRPKSVEAWYNKAMYLQESGSRKKERYNEAFACYDSILKIEPSFVASNFNKGFIWLEYKTNYDSAAVYFGKAIEQNPAYFQAYYNRALCYESKEEYKLAESDYRAALSYAPQYTEAANGLNRVLGRVK